MASYREKYQSPRELITSARNYVRAADTGRQSNWDSHTYVKAKEDGWDKSFTSQVEILNARRYSTLPPVTTPRKVHAPHPPKKSSSATRKSRRPRNDDEIKKSAREEMRRRREREAEERVAEKERKNGENQRRKEEKERRRKQQEEEEAAAAQKQKEEEEERRRKQQEEEEAAAAQKEKEEEEERRRKQQEEEEAATVIGQCDNCGKDVLKSEDYYTVGEESEGESKKIVKAACLEEWKDKNSLKCTRCGERIEGDYVTLDDKPYKTECAEIVKRERDEEVVGQCANCGKDITRTEDYFTVGGGDDDDGEEEKKLVKAACLEEWKDKNSLKCTRCGERIEGDYVTLDDKPYKTECAEIVKKEHDGEVIGKCDNCGNDITKAEDYFSLGGGDDDGEEKKLVKAACLEEWKDKNQPKCTRCGERIEGDYVTLDGKPYKTECAEIVKKDARGDTPEAGEVDAEEKEGSQPIDESADDFEH